MGITSDMINSWQSPHLTIPDWTWVEGALAGLDVCKSRDPDWLWESFVSELKSMKDQYNIQPLHPWQESEENSIHSALGGYVSLTGKVASDGLRFPLPYKMSEKICNHFPSIEMSIHSHGITIPWKSMDSFTTIVHLRGPVEEWIQEASN